MTSPKSRLWWTLWVCVCLWLVSARKWCNYGLTNLLFGLGTSMWVSDVLVNLTNIILEFQHTFLPPKWCEPRSTPQLFFPFVIFTFGLAIESIKEFGGVSQMHCLHLEGIYFLLLFYFVCYCLYFLFQALCYYHHSPQKKTLWEK